MKTSTHERLRMCVCKHKVQDRIYGASIRLHHEIQKLLTINNTLDITLDLTDEELIYLRGAISGLLWAAKNYSAVSGVLTQRIKSRQWRREAESEKA